ncbi:Transposable element tcb1 transposase [Caligus rogercresseyi]|uniref:Transposable element tcb1 transposase n=1 Tax=Caligus rogercresseyi TaxID=217165 RepID=A0A7T8GSS3_CALRO|nr:Transposable element tcb1 transposase [Caligus rogercresseyi]
MDSVASGTPYTFQQDSAPVHKAKLVQSWLKKNVPNFWYFNIWPPNSPDLNPRA